MSALSNAVAVLRLFSVERPALSVTDVSRLLGMPKSSASRLLKAMLGAGLLANADDKPRYRVGPLFFEIARLHGSGSRLMDLADAALAAICRQTGHTGYVSVLDGADVLVLRVHPGTQTLRVVTPLGSRAPAYATANGRMLLARLDGEAVRALHPAPLAPRSGRSPQTLDEVLNRLRQARSDGWCEAIDEAVPGVGSVAVSVADAENTDMLAFCLSFPAHMVSEAERRELAGLLIGAAERIAAQVGDRFLTQARTRRAA
jgi:DNA-binding IclR family transcriptional regulator